VVLAGVSGSAMSWRALAYAVGVARRHDALLVCVHVCEWKRPPQELSARVDLRRQESQGVELASEMSTRLTEDVSCWAARSTVIVRRGDPFVELSAVAGDSQR
jgi:nucleotide-binding universal stress UspA family protein